MKQITEMHELNTLINEAGTKLYTNCYMLLPELSRYITLQSLFYEINESGLVLYCDEKLYFALYYYLNPEIAFRIQKKDKPIVARTVYSYGNKPKSLDMIEKNLYDSGFSFHGITRQMSLRPEETDLYGTNKTQFERLKQRGYMLRSASLEEIEFVLKLRNSALPFYHFSYMTDKEVEAKISSGAFNCIFNSSGELCAMHQISINKNSYTTDAIVIEEEYRKCGMGSALIYSCLHKAIENNIFNYNLWVEEDNLPAVRFHESYGCKFTAKVADEFIAL